jgi:tetratricopeptide (TPR) repeat protein
MADALRDRLQAALGDAYQIERELAPGGMSRLFLATERSLAREVVIKVLPPELASEVSAARFQREMSLAAQLQHPHVLPVLSAGSRDGLLFYLMPYVRGESLRHRLQREGKLSIADAVLILSEVADALAYAHERGVVHRDVKPENILLEANHAVLSDFGIARAVGGDDHAVTGPHITATGVRVGTPGYMSPEQLVGDASVDARTDVYALAVVGYEMLAGASPFVGKTPSAVVAAHLTARPTAVRAVRPETPAAVSDAIDRALSKDAVDRPANAGEFRRLLGAAAPPPRERRSWRIPIVVAIAAGVLVATALGVRYARTGLTSRVGASTVAVLPFAPTGPTSIEYLSAGMVNLLSTTLDGAGDLHTADPRAVLAAASHVAPTALGVDGARQIANQLGANLFVLGSLVDVGGRLRMSAALYGDQSSEPLARASADGDTSDVFGLVDRLGAQLLVGRRQGPSSRITQLAAVTTRSLPALKAYLEGETAMRVNAFETAEDAFRRAIAADSGFALAYFRLGKAEEWLTHAEESTRAAEQAVAHADRLSSHDKQLLAAMLTERHGDPDEAERMLRALLTTYPDDYEAWWQLGEILFHHAPVVGRPLGDAELPFRRVLALDATSEPALVHLARIMASEHRREATDSLVGRSLEISPRASRSFEMRVLRASVDGDSTQLATLIPELTHIEDFEAWLPGWSALLYGHDFATARMVFAQLADDPARPAYVRARAVSMLAALDVLHGRFADAQSRLVQVAPLSTAWSYEYRGLIAVLPYPSPDTGRARMRAMRDTLERWDAAATPVVPPSASTFSSMNGLHPLVREYLIGMLDVSLGDTAGAARAAHAMSALPSASANPALTQSLANAVLAPKAVLPVIEYYQWLLASAFRAEARERYRWAQVMAAQGQDTVAIRWYGSFEASAPDDMFFLAPSHLERARLYARHGQKSQAQEQYRAFLSLWSNCDPALKPIVAQAERERAAL